MWEMVREVKEGGIEEVELEEKVEEKGEELEGKLGLGLGLGLGEGRFLIIVLEGV